MWQHHTPFRHGNLLSLPRSKWGGVYGRGSIEATFMADLIVRLDTFEVVKDRYNATTKTPHRALIRLYEAIEAGEKVLVLT